MYKNIFHERRIDMNGNMIKMLCGSILVTSLLFSGCGGGGGGGGVISAGAGAGQSGYIGVTTQALITEANKKVLCYDAYQAGKVASPLGSIGKRVPDADPSSTGLVPGPQSITRIIEDEILEVAVQQQKSSSRQVAAVVSQPGTIYGPNGGSATYTISVNDATGSFSGVMVFLDYQSAGTTLSGKSDFSGVINLQLGQFTSLSMTLVSLHASESGVAITITGKMTKETSGTDKNITTDMVVLYDAAKTAYWINNYRYITKQDGTMSLTGRYYDPAYGYVDISTVIPLTASAINVEPSAGVLLFSGSNGITGRLTFTTGGHGILLEKA
jgi:hypothetical protein